MTYMQAFEKIKSKLDGKAKISGNFPDFAIQVELTNKDCSGIFYLKYDGKNLDIQPYDYVDNTAAIAVSYTSFLKITDGRQTVDDAISKGILSVNGNREVVYALSTIVPKDKPAAEKKPAAAKKTAAKAAEKTDSKASAKKETKPAAVKASAEKPEPKKAEPQKTAVKKTEAKKPEVKKAVETKKAEVQSATTSASKKTTAK